MTPNEEIAKAIYGGKTWEKIHGTAYKHDILSAMKQAQEQVMDESIKKVKDGFLWSIDSAKAIEILKKVKKEI